MDVITLVMVSLNRWMGRQQEDSIGCLRKENLGCQNFATSVGR